MAKSWWFSGYNGTTGVASADFITSAWEFNSSEQPQIFDSASTLNLGVGLTLTGVGFQGVSEGSSGNSQRFLLGFPGRPIALHRRRANPLHVRRSVQELVEHCVHLDAAGVRVLSGGLGSCYSFCQCIPSISAEVLVDAPLLITGESQSQQVLFGGEATFSVAATGQGAITYQWLLNGKPLLGATNSVLTVSNAQNTNAGNYQVVVSGAFGSIASAVQTLTVSGVIILQGPQIVITAPTNVVNLQAVSVKKIQPGFPSNGRKSAASIKSLSRTPPARTRARFLALPDRMSWR